MVTVPEGWIPDPLTLSRLADHYEHTVVEYTQQAAREAAAAGEGPSEYRIGMLAGLRAVVGDLRSNAERFELEKVWEASP